MQYSCKITLDSTGDHLLHNVNYNDAMETDNPIGGIVFTINADELKANSYTYKLNFSNENDLLKYKERFEVATKTKWNAYGRTIKGKDTVYSRTFVCKSSNYRHVPYDKNKRPQKRSKVTDCKAKMHVKIKNNRFVSEFPSEITIKGTHNHTINLVGPCRTLPILKETLDELKPMFMANLTPSQARHKLRIRILENGINPEKIQDTRYLPESRQIYHLWDKWRKASYGTTWNDSLALLQKKCNSDPRIKICEDKKVISIVTPLMERVHKFIPQAAEMVFIDSTSSVDQFQSSVTFIMTASPIGAMPLGVIISDGQDEESYTQGFKMIKEITEGYGFYGNTSPKVIMTDDALAERNALKEIFPEAISLLCIFHFLQVSKIYIKHFFCLFKKFFMKIFESEQGNYLKTAV